MDTADEQWWLLLTPAVQIDQLQPIRIDTMDRALSASDISQSGARAVVAPSLPEDDLAFFQALWFWIPAALVVWSAIVWTVFRVV